MKYYAKGKRGLIFLGLKGKKRVIVKKARKDSKAISFIDNEIYWLKKLNKFEIGPKLLDVKKIDNDKAIVMEFIDGVTFLKWYEENKNKKKKIVISVIKEILRQCRLLDKLKVDKKEMISPVKHIIITEDKSIKNKVRMIDFERARFSLKPGNVTQFFQFLGKIGVLKIDNNIINDLKEYKNNYKVLDFKRLISYVK